MTSEEIEEFIRCLDEKTRDMCVCPDKMTFDCCDCYLCRKDFFEHVREELKNKQGYVFLHNPIFWSIYTVEKGW